MLSDLYHVFCFCAKSAASTLKYKLNWSNTDIKVYVILILKG